MGSEGLLLALSWREGIPVFVIGRTKRGCVGIKQSHCELPPVSCAPNSLVPVVVYSIVFSDVLGVSV